MDVLLKLFHILQESEIYRSLIGYIILLKYLCVWPKTLYRVLGMTHLMHVARTKIIDPRVHPCIKYYKNLQYVFLFFKPIKGSDTPPPSHPTWISHCKSTLYLKSH